MVSLVSEGNAHIVVSLDDQSGVPSVLRLVKDHSKSRFDVEFKKTFYEKIVQKFFGHEFCLQMDIVSLSMDILVSISNSIESSRDENRKIIGLDMNQTAGIRMQDLTRISSRNPCLAIEFKPKWGFLPSYYKTRTCRFCLHQRLKSSAKEPSEYCPLDLFSTKKNRVCKAVSGLIATPQNNLRLFLNGRLIAEDQAKNVLSNFFCTSFKEIIHALADVLLKSKLLPLLKHYQAYLDCDPKELSNLESDLDLDAVNRELPSRLDRILQDILDDTPSSDDVDTLLKFLLSATLKDVSLIIRLAPSNELPEALSVNKAPFSYDIHLLDADPKSAHKLVDMLSLHEQLGKVSVTLDKVCEDEN